MTDDKHKQKMAKRKELHDKKMSDKTTGKGLLIVHTGTGKGKSTASFGMALRAMAHGMKVGMVQFIKGPWDSGERKIFEQFPDLIELHAVGEGFTWETQDKSRDIEHAKKGFSIAKELIARDDIDLVILDELNIALRYDYLDLKEVLDAFKARPHMTHIVVTGRNAKAELIEQADMVTEMKLIKHPFKEQGIKAQKGIEF